MRCLGKAEFLLEALHDMEKALLYYYSFYVLLLLFTPKHCKQTHNLYIWSLILNEQEREEGLLKGGCKNGGFVDGADMRKLSLSEHSSPEVVKILPNSKVSRDRAPFFKYEVE